MTFEELVRAAKDKRAVTGLPSGKHMPAAFVLNYPGGMLANLLPHLKLYVKKEDRDA